MPPATEIYDAKDLAKAACDNKSKKKPLIIDLTIEGILAPESHADLFYVAENCKVRKAVVKNVFHDDSLCKFLKALGDNKHSRKVFLDISGNEFHASCYEELKSLLSKKMVNSVILPAGLSEVENLLKFISERNIKLKVVGIPNAHLTDASIECLEKLLSEKKISEKLDLSGCTSTDITMQEERLQNIVKRCNSRFSRQKLSLIWQEVVLSQNASEEKKLSQAEFRESIPSDAISMISKESGYNSLSSSLTPSLLSINKETSTTTYTAQRVDELTPAEVKAEAISSSAKTVKEDFKFSPKIPEQDNGGEHTGVSSSTNLAENSELSTTSKLPLQGAAQENSMTSGLFRVIGAIAPSAFVDLLKRKMGLNVVKVNAEGYGTCVDNAETSVDGCSTSVMQDHTTMKVQEESGSDSSLGQIPEYQKISDISGQDLDTAVALDGITRRLTCRNDKLLPLPDELPDHEFAASPGDHEGEEESKRNIFKETDDIVSEEEDYSHQAEGISGLDTTLKQIQEPTIPFDNQETAPCHEENESAKIKFIDDAPREEKENSFVAEAELEEEQDKSGSDTPLEQILEAEEILASADEDTDTKVQTNEPERQQGKDSIYLHDVELDQGLFSCPFSAEIEPNSEVTVKVHDCLISFPQNSFEQVNKIEGKLEIDPKYQRIRIGNSLPHILISPMLFVKSQNSPQELVSVKLTTWCVKKRSEFGHRANVHVLHLPDGSDEWEIFATRPFSGETEFQFETMDFSPYAIALGPEWQDVHDLVVWSSLYVDDYDNFLFVFQLKSMLLADHLNELLHPHKKLQFLSETVVGEGDEIRGKISAENLAFHHGGDFSVLINTLRAGNQPWKKFPTFITNNEQATANGRIRIKFEVHRNDAVVDEGIFQFIVRAGDRGPAAEAPNYIYADHVEIIQDGRIINRVQGAASLIGLQNGNEGGPEQLLQDDANHEHQPAIQANQPEENVPQSQDFNNENLAEVGAQHNSPSNIPDAGRRSQQQSYLDEASILHQGEVSSNHTNQEEANLPPQDEDDSDS